MQDIQLSKLKRVLQLAYNQFSHVRCSKKSFENGCFVGASHERKEVINLDNGTYRLETVNRESGELIQQYAGGSLNETPNKSFVGMAFHKKPCGFEFCESNIELLFTETFEHLSACINKDSMEHLNFYIVFEINSNGGRCVDVFKNDSSGVCDEMRNYSWKDVAFALRRNKDYPIGIISEQKLHSHMQPNVSPKDTFKRVSPFLNQLQQADLSKQRVA